MRIARILLIVSFVAPTLHAQKDWPTFGHDQGGQRFSPLTQINADNVSELIPAWSFRMQKEGQAFRASQSTPLVVNGVMYLSWPLNHVAALEPESGKVLWEYTARGAYRGNGLGSLRSLAYWPGDKQLPPQILFGTEEGELYSLNARTGKLSPGFGNEGIVNLKTSEVMNGFPNMHYGMTSAPLVYQHLVITGSHIVDETGSRGPAGDVRAWDVRTGKLVWTFHTVPRPGEPGNETWLNDSWRNASGANAWTFFTLDETRGILYMPLGSANNDYYGVDRPGANLFANSLVAVDARTGKLKWYFQTIHHDLWDYDMPVPPILFDVAKDGKKIPAVGAMSKNAMLFILDRITGKPIYGVEERPVPKGDLPGEYYSPTQPFPVKPPPLARLSFTIGDIAKITPEHEAACRELFTKNEGGRNRGPYTPPSEKGAFNMPTQSGGANWSGGTLDPTLGFYIINTTDSGGYGFVWPQDSDPSAPSESPRLFGHGSSPRGTRLQRGPGPGAASGALAQDVSRGAAAFDPMTVDGLPCWQPPWGRLTAINVNTGDIAWQIPFGTMSGVPADIMTGAPNSGGGPISTAGGVTFIGAARDGLFRAFNTKDGKELWHAKTEEVIHAVPISYLGKDGRQYIAAAAGAIFLAYRLP